MSDFAPATVEAGNVVSFGNDQGLVVEFYNKESHNPRASEEAGRPIYTEKLFVHIMIPGDKSTDIHRPVKPSDKQRFQRQWEAFQADMEPVLEGTPLEEWSLLNVAQRAELKALNIRTVEHLAGLNENLLDRVGHGAQKLKAMAADYIERAKGNVDEARFARELETRDIKIDLLEKQLSEITSRLEEASKAKEAPAPVQTMTEEASSLDDLAEPTVKSALDDLPEPTPVKRKPGRPRKVA